MENLLQKEFDKIFGSAEKHKRFKKLQESIGLKRFTISDVGVPHRWIMHWHSSGLLFGEYEEGKWRKFDMLEYVWIKMILKMREFKISLKTIKKVREALLPEIDYDKHFNNDFSVSLMAKQFTGVSKDDIREFLKSEEMKKIIERKFNLLKHIILDCLIDKGHSALLINKEGEVFPFKEAFLDYYMNDAGFLKFFRSSHISISITDILSEFISLKDIKLLNNELSFITDEEARIFDILTEDNLKSVVISYDKNNMIDLIKVTKNQKVDKRARLVELIMNNGYQDITITTQKGDVVYCENTRKIKLKEFI